MRAAVTLADWLRFDSTTVGINGGPTMKADRSGRLQPRRRLSGHVAGADFEEAYFDVRLPVRRSAPRQAEGRLGQARPLPAQRPDQHAELQRSVPAGRSGAQDRRARGAGVVLSARRLAAAGGEPAHRRVGAAVRAVSLRAGAAATCRMAVSHCDTERWFPPAAMPATTFESPPASSRSDGAGNPAFTVPIGFRVHNTPSPALRLENNEIGLRYSGDWSTTSTLPSTTFMASTRSRPSTSPPTRSGSATRIPPIRCTWPACRPSRRCRRCSSRSTPGAPTSRTPSIVSRVRGEGAFVSGRPFSRDLRVLVTDPAIAGG